MVTRKRFAIDGLEVFFTSDSVRVVRISNHNEPDSDMDFISFKKLMKSEWYEQSKKRNSRKYIKFNNTKI